VVDIAEGVIASKVIERGGEIVIVIGGGRELLDLIRDAVE